MQERKKKALPVFAESISKFVHNFDSLIFTASQLFLETTISRFSFAVLQNFASKSLYVLWKHKLKTFNLPFTNKQHLCPVNTLQLTSKAIGA